MVNTEVFQQSSHRGEVEEAAEGRCIWLQIGDKNYILIFDIFDIQLTIQTQIVERQDGRFRGVALNRDRDLAFIGRHTTNVTRAAY